MPDRIIVTFIPQKWAGRKQELCIPDGEPIKVDVTQRILEEYSFKALHLLKSCSYDADDLVEGLHPDIDNHGGPFEVEGIEAALCEYFGVDDQADITEEMLAAKRNTFLSQLDSQPPATVKRRLIIDVEYDLNGENIATLEGLLEQIATGASNRGLLSGDTAATVESWSHRIEVVA